MKHSASKFPLSKNNITPFFSTGSLQLYHIVEDLLLQTGKADLFISSFTVAEEFIRKLYNLKEDDLINSIDLLIDERSARRTLHLSYFLSQVTNHVYLANNHSKLILIKNNQFKVSVITSQNQTRGNRFENGIILTLPDIYDYYEEKIKGALERSISLDDIFAR